MKFLNGVICVLSVLTFLSCKKSATESNDSDANNTVPVEITRVTVDRTDVSPGDTVRLTCETEYPDGLNYHWDLALGSTSDDSGIIEKANASGTFNQGRWIRWLPAIPGEWTATVIAYVPAADHSSQGNGTWSVYFEYSPANHQLVRRHCFNYADKGRLWDQKEVPVQVAP